MPGRVIGQVRCEVFVAANRACEKAQECVTSSICTLTIRVLKSSFVISQMPHPNTLEVKQSALLIIDMQEAFRASIADFNQTAARTVLAVKGSALLRVPVLVTEQYPKGLGHTAAEIKAVLPEDTEIIEKSTFSSCGSQTFQGQLERTQVKQVLVAGLETHICVNQTVHDLLANGFQVHLLTDCITSRKRDDKKVALEKMQLSGAIPSSLELALFELMRDSKHEQFKAIQGLIK